jgi:hypothetical protein
MVVLESSAGAEQAARTMEAACPAMDERKSVLAQLLTSAGLAGAISPDCWAVTLLRSGFRLNVGSVEALNFLGGRMELFFCGPVPERVDGHGEIRDCPMRSAPSGSFSFRGTPAAFEAVGHLLAPGHASYIASSAVGRSGKPRRTSYARFHSQALMEYASSFVGQPAPDRHSSARQGDSLVAGSGSSLDRRRDKPGAVLSGGTPYNGYSWRERMAKLEQMKRRIAEGSVSPPQGPCRLCGDPGPAGSGVVFEYHDEDYSRPYRWDEPAAYVLCHDCHVFRLHQRFAHPLSWRTFLAHVRRGGYAREMRDPVLSKELDAYKNALRNHEDPPDLAPLRPCGPRAGTEWFARLTMDVARMTDPASRPRP